VHRSDADRALAVAEAEARYHRERLALYRARVLTGRPTSPDRLKELERRAAHAADWARRVRDGQPSSPGGSGG
jgi:hypothetical protein